MKTEGLFTERDDKARMAFLASRHAALAPDEIVVDLFCGGGGATQGVEDAGLAVHECVNHCASAIATHTTNHPKTNHRQGDVWKNTPANVAAGRPVGFAWFSPDCRHFSRARGAAPVSRRVRDLAWVVVKWAQSTAAPRVIIVENVPEFMTWGPTRAKRKGRRIAKDSNGRVLMEPIPERAGETFRRWVRQMRRAGYELEWKVLDAADFGAASRRKRLYIIARRDGAPIIWPEKSHGPKGSTLTPYRAAADVIDWSDLGTSIFSRKRPLKDKTLARIAEGIRRYVLNDPRPFILRVTQTGGEGHGWKVSDILGSMPTQTTRQDLAVVTPVIAKHYGGVVGHKATDGLGTITAIDHHSLVTPVVAVCAHGDGKNGTKRWGKAALSADEPLNAIHAGGNNFGIASPVMVTTGYGEREGQRPRCTEVSQLLGTAVNGVKQALCTPVLGHLNHGGKQTSDVAEPLRTVVAGGLHHGLISPLLMSAGGPECAAAPAAKPMGTVLPTDRMAMVGALLIKFYGSGGQWSKPDAPMGTATTHDRHGLVCVVLGGVEYVIVDILFRMLKPKELAAAMGFPSTYTWPATQREAVRLIGNAVSPPQAEALTRSVLPRGRARKVAAA